MKFLLNLEAAKSKTSESVRCPNRDLYIVLPFAFRFSLLSQKMFGIQMTIVLFKNVRNVWAAEA